MPTYEQVAIFFTIIVRIIIEIFFVFFCIIVLAGILAKTFKWFFKKKETEDSTVYSVEAKLKD